MLAATEVNNMQVATELHSEVNTPIVYYEVANVLQAKKNIITKDVLQDCEFDAVPTCHIDSTTNTNKDSGFMAIENYFQYRTRHKELHNDDCHMRDDFVLNNVVIPEIPLITYKAGNEDWDDDSIVESSGSEYVPSENDNNDDSDDEESWKEPIPHQKSNIQEEELENPKPIKKIVNRRNNMDCTGKEYSIAIVNSSKDGATGKRIRDKVHSCYFCHKNLKQLAIHFEKVHSDESEVAKLLAMPKNCKERRNGFGNLLKIGDYYHNCEILMKKEGELILVRRPTPQEKVLLDYNDYGPCPDCLGFMLKKHIWHHLKYGCTAKKINESGSMHRKPMSESAALISHTFGDKLSNHFVFNILTKLKEDRISLVCRQDNLIKQFGALQFEKYHITQCELIRQTMRQLSRLVLELRRLDPSNCWLSQWLRPDCFDLIISAVKNICTVCYQTINRPQFSIPSLALKLGHSLRKCIAIERGNALRRGDLQRNENLSSLLTIMDLEWTIKISSNALATLHTRKINATELLPLTDDLIKLNSFLNSEMTACKQLLLTSSSKTYQNWSRLAAVALSKIVLFNKRRSGEASEMTLEQYSSRPNWTQSGTEKFRKTLSPLELELASRLTLIEIVGKRHRKVSVLLTDDVKQVIDLLIKTRSDVCVSKENSYIFARGNDSKEHIRGHDCLKKLCSEADLQQPELINGTQLRKYIATVCQIFNLTENESEWLARHLGHDIRAHRDFYRLHDSSIEMTKVSRLLMAVEHGEASKFHGKKLNEINITDLPALENEEEDNVEDSDGEENNQENSADDTQAAEDVISTISSNIRKAKLNSAVTKAKPNEVVTNKTKSTRKITKCARQAATKRPWSEQESGAVISFFKTNIKASKIPGKVQCEQCMELHRNVLSSRSWKDIKYYVKNYVTKTKQGRA